MKSRFSFLLLLGISLPVLVAHVSTISAQESEEQPTSAATPAEVDEAVHNELRVLREGLIEALVAGDIEKQLTYAHEDIVTTWQNNKTTHGINELEAFFTEINPEGQKTFQGYKQKPETDAPSIIYGGDTAVAFGSSVPSYKLLGMEFDLQNRWSATLVKQDGKWLIASYHVSANVLDNPLLAAAKQSVYLVGGVCLLVGLVLGGVIAMFVKRNRA